MNADDRRFGGGGEGAAAGEKPGRGIRCFARGRSHAMPTAASGFEHPELTEKIIGIFYQVYNELGYGFLESVYEAAMSVALAEAGLSVCPQFPVSVHFRGRSIGEFKIDLLVENIVTLELKAARTLDASHEAQTLNYLRATNIEIALLLNFGPKPEIKRLVFSNARKVRASI
jgi:GxxExxY protein